MVRIMEMSMSRHIFHCQRVLWVRHCSPSVVPGARFLRWRTRLSVLPSNIFRIWQFVVFLPLHPTVLEPDFDLSFGKAERVSDLYPSSPRQVAVEVELFFQLQDLMTSIRSPLPLWLHTRLVRPICWNKKINLTIKINNNQLNNFSFHRQVDFNYIMNK